ncbi:Uncharacterised protein [Leminorella richardii]|uniref:SmpA / OmlA family n=1 Tax=Leminorella richardii TaxID=158841 RepID=A0A2X4V8L7_9GAMM|nr:hypothetical protein [Leminorella richardii]SQI41640.1 Uncharacterised protein [Leminorella richardii]
MKNITITLGLIATLSLVSGCAKMKDIGAYTTGTEVSQNVMNSFVDGKTKQKDVIAAIGHPNEKSQLGKVEVWKYNYTKIRHVGSNVNESTVFEWNSKGVLKSHYKTNGGGGATGNALLDAAAGR